MRAEQAKGRAGLVRPGDVGEQERFIARMKGIPSDALARAMSTQGISFVGCSKAHMAKVWAMRNSPNSGYGRLADATLDSIHSKALSIRDDIAKRALQRLTDAQRADEHIQRQIVRRSLEKALPHLLLNEALCHLDTVLNGCRSSADQERADRAAREFLASCGR